MFASQVQLWDKNPHFGRLTLTNDQPRPQVAEVEFPLGYRGVSAKLVKRDGWMVWRVTIPSNGAAKLTFRVIADQADPPAAGGVRRPARRR